MTRLFTDGAEMGDMLWWDYVSSGNASITGTAASGSYAYNIYRDAYCEKYITAMPEGYVKFRIDWAPAGLYTYQIAKFPCFLYNGTELAWLQFNGSNQIAAYIQTIGQVASYATIPNSYQFYLMEIYFKIADSEGRFVVKLDGVTIIDYTGDTKGGTNTTFNRIRFVGGMEIVAPHQTIIVDDLACNSTSGASDASWCGSGRVELLKPNAEGDKSEWVCSTGTTHYQLVDDIPSNGDSDYVYTTVASKQDSYNLGTFSDTNKIVDRIWVDARAKDNSVGSGQIKVGFKTGSTIYLQTTAVTLPGAYTRVAGDEALLNPATGLIWNKTDLDALQVVVESET